VADGDRLVVFDGDRFQIFGLDGRYRSPAIRSPTHELATPGTSRFGWSSDTLFAFSGGYDAFTSGKRDMKSGPVRVGWLRVGSRATRLLSFSVPPRVRVARHLLRRHAGRARPPSHCPLRDGRLLVDVAARAPAVRRPRPRGDAHPTGPARGASRGWRRGTMTQGGTLSLLFRARPQVFASASFMSRSSCGCSVEGEPQSLNTRRRTPPPPREQVQPLPGRQRHGEGSVADPGQLLDRPAGSP